MSVPVSLPCVLVDAHALARIVPGGRAAVRQLLAAHPAVLSVARDRRLEAAYFADDRAGDAHELAAEIRRVLPGGSALRKRCVVLQDADHLPVETWLTVKRSGDKALPCATHADAAPARVARRRVIREATALEPVATRSIHLAQRALARFGWPDLSARATSCYALVTGPALVTPLSVVELEDGRLLGMTVWLPVLASAATTDALAAAIARLNELFTWCCVRYEPGERGVRVQRAFEAPLEGTTVDVVANQLDLMLHFANTVGVALARVALGHATTTEVEASAEELLKPAG